MVQCESAENCRYAKEGWFHPLCLGFSMDDVTKNNIFDDCNFFCPGCWVDKGNPFSEWGEAYRVGKKRIAMIRKNLSDLWANNYRINLKRIK